MMMLIYINQHPSNILSSVNESVKQHLTGAELKRCVAYKYKNHIVGLNLIGRV